MRFHAKDRLAKIFRYSHCPNSLCCFFNGGIKHSALCSHALQKNDPITKRLYKKGIPLPATFLVHQNGALIYASRAIRPPRFSSPRRSLKCWPVFERLWRFSIFFYLWVNSFCSTRNRFNLYDLVIPADNLFARSA